MNTMISDNSSQYILFEVHNQGNSLLNRLLKLAVKPLQAGQWVMSQEARVIESQSANPEAEYIQLPGEKQEGSQND
ncbi:hypothetical protein [Desulfosediminicola ganghwensis]|uniref:hypothetical protein n=1 Tax=Desulfosediminicola ganghwensis TaxID=2569540 RepID=UPI0010AB7AD2|nr:hypothetical protein [Desulfosediminicola ganghwensis]